MGTDAGSWQLDSNLMDGNVLTVSISRSVDTTGCTICKDVDANSYVLWAVGSAYPSEPDVRTENGLNYHSQRGVLGQYVLSASTTEPTVAPTTASAADPTTT